MTYRPCKLILRNGQIHIVTADSKQVLVAAHSYVFKNKTAAARFVQKRVKPYLLNGGHLNAKYWRMTKAATRKDAVPVLSDIPLFN